MITRRQLLRGSGATFAGSALLPGLRTSASLLGQAGSPESRIDIAPCTLEYAKGRSLRTIGYNGQVPGPLLRLREGQTSIVEVMNRTADAEVVHWHGLHLPSQIDGSMEEGTPAIAPGATARYSLPGRPAGFRWYHTHTFAGASTSKAQYGGQHGFLYVAPSHDTGRYDREVFLALHDWRGHMLGSDDGSMNPVYDVSTINGRTLGFGEPIRVRQGERLQLHVLNSSPTEPHWIAFAGHQFQVIALDGNPVPVPKSVSMLRLAPAERVTAIVEMTNPGVWVLGEARKHIQAAGMGVVVEYSGASGRPVWHQPEQLAWTYGQFASAGAERSRESGTSHIDEILLVFQSRFAGHGAPERWTINGKSYPEVTSPKLVENRQYRLRLRNASRDDHPIHLHRHTFAVNGLSDEGAVGPGVMKDTIFVRAGTEAAVTFLADNPGPSLLHCHQQDHMDRGFMMVFDYA